MPRTSVASGPISEATAEPAWEIAYLFPAQGAWTEEEYLALDTNRLVEFSHGRIEVPPMPSPYHQLIVAHLFGLLDQYVRTLRLGVVWFAPLPLRLWEGKIREPDIIYLGRWPKSRRGDKYLLGADLVMEVVSPDDPDRDKVIKRQEYAQARIPEYWIVDPETERITVLTLSGQTYSVHGEFAAGDQATSVLLDGFTVDVTEAFASAERP